MAYVGPWRVVRSLETLRTQLNLLFPGRSKASDGTIADSAHGTTSDHYPHRVTGLGDIPVVTALDITSDPTHGVHCGEIGEAIRVSRDPRVKYFIWDHRMFSSYASGAYPAWSWRPYTGSNDPHTNHFHLSVLNAPIADHALPWSIGVDMSFTVADHVRLKLLFENWSPTREEWIAASGDPAAYDAVIADGSGRNALALRLAELGPATGFSESEIRRFVREELEGILTRAHIRVDPAI